MFDLAGGLWEVRVGVGLGALEWGLGGGGRGRFRVIYAQEQTPGRQGF